MAKLLGDSPVHTASGTPMGTPLYMSPEQARGDKVDGRSDVYAMGVLCHELLTGHLPINGESTLVVLVAHLMQAPLRVSEAQPDLSPELDEPVLRMLEKNPSSRPATAGEALASLILAAESAGHVIPPGLPHLPPPPPRSQSAKDCEEFSPTSPTPLAPIDQDARGTEPDFERQALVRSAQVTPRKRSASFPFLLTIVALGGGATYLATSAMKPSLPAVVASVHPAASLAPAPEARSAEPAPTPTTEQPKSPPEAIELTVRGAPQGARVWFDGKSLGEASAPLPVPFAESPVQLTVTAPGHEPQTLTLTPNKAQDASVKLAKKRGSGAAVRGAIPSDLESPF